MSKFITLENRYMAISKALDIIMDATDIDNRVRYNREYKDNNILNFIIYGEFNINEFQKLNNKSGNLFTLEDIYAQQSGILSLYIRYNNNGDA